MISNGGNFQVAARLAYITGNETYSDWATMVWDWMAGTAMFDRADDGLLYIWDNVNADKDCGEPVRFIWSYNYGVLLGGAAYMYNHTNGSSEWKERIDELLDSAIRLYFPAEHGGNVMEEYLCEEDLICNQDQKSFKAYLSRWMAATALLVPDTWDTIMPLLSSSAQAAARQCSGGSSGTMCSQQWFSNVHTGESGVGEQVRSLHNIKAVRLTLPSQMSALAVIGASMMDPSMAPLSQESGATSESNPTSGLTHNGPEDFKDITDGDRAGAAILTILVCVSLVGTMVWIVIGE